MIDPRAIEWLHAELDGELAPAERDALARALASSAELRAARAELHGLAAALREGVAEPSMPADLHQQIMQAIDSARAANVPAPATGTRAPTFFPKRRIAWGRAHGNHTHARRGNSMKSTSRKILVVGVAIAVVAVAGGVAWMGNILPSGGSEMAAATIAPAHRYEATQIANNGIQLGDQSVAQFMQTDTYQQIVNDPGLVQALDSDAFRKALDSDAFRKAIDSGAFYRMLHNDAFMKAMNNDAFLQVLRSDAFQKAMNNDAFDKAMHNDAFRQAMKNDAFRKAMKNDAFLKAMHNDAFLRVLHNDAFMKAMDSVAFRQMLHNDAFMKAMHNDAFLKAMHNDAFLKAMHNDAARLAQHNAAE